MWNGERPASTNERMNGNTPNLQVACWWSLNFLTSIELDGASISKWTEEQLVSNDFFCQKRLWVVKKLFSVLLKIPGFKCKTEDLEGDSDIENEEESWNLVLLRTDRGTQILLWLLIHLT